MDKVEKEEGFKAGFVSLIGQPNAGKSTLLNALIGEKVSIVSPKVQTTRHRIRGMLNTEEYQIVFSDTPGIIEPKYRMQSAMMDFVKVAMEDADIILYLIDVTEKDSFNPELLKAFLVKEKHVLLILNKVDLLKGDQALLKQLDTYGAFLPKDQILPLSAKYKFNLDQILKAILHYLPNHPPFFSADQFTDISERFWVAECIREQIYDAYRKEIPYHTDVAVTEFVEKEDIIEIHADIFVGRKSQKPIIIGKDGAALKHVGKLARMEMEAFFNKKVFLSLFVKVKEDWRDNTGFLKRLGFNAQEA